MHSILLVSTGGLPDRESLRVRTLIEHRVAAVLFLSTPETQTLEMIGAGIPKVFVGLTMPGQLSVSVDEFSGTKLAVEHLVTLGHRKIGFISAMLADELYMERIRFQGFSAGMSESGLEVSPSWLLRANTSKALSAHDHFDQIIKLLSGRNRPTAIVAALDRIALEVISAADHLGIAIPDQLSVVGFDDIALAGHSRIALTTVAQPMQDLARIAVDAAIDGKMTVEKQLTRDKIVLLEPKLVQRGTTAGFLDLKNP